MVDKSLITRTLGSRSELILVAVVVGILLVLFTPIPPWLLDFLLIVNVSCALLVLLMTLYTDKPLEFSTFPTLLLITTMFRLALNIASTRLILSEGDAGHVINAVGTHVVGGNYVIGLVVFFILVVVQYVVVTNGAQRVAEVAARFTLDSMPGKQMSIDADMNMGLIDDIEARARRKDIEREASFYGAMDGASKFVKGDAIAGILIIFINIIGGLVIGIAQLGMPWGDALHKYTLLTVGDGIVTQIPALIIATATGIIVTRAATDARFGEEIAVQVNRYPKSLVMVSFGLLLMLFLPGIPSIPVLIIFALFACLAFFALRTKTSVNDASAQDVKGEDGDIYASITLLPLELRIGKGLASFIGDDSGALSGKIKSLREQLAHELGFVLPAVKINTDSASNEYEYVIRLNGNKIASGFLYPGKLLAINSNIASIHLDGIETKDPSYGLPAMWIDFPQKQMAKEAGCTIVEPITVLVTHFSEVVRTHSHELLTRTEVDNLMNTIKTRQPGLFEELVPGILAVSDVQKVLQKMLKEKVTIRPLGLIVESLIDVGRTTKDIDNLVEVIRSRCGRSICEPLLSKQGSLNVITMEPSLEQTFQSGLRGEGTGMLVEPRVTEGFISALVSEAEKMMANGHPPILLCSPSLRRHIRKLVDRVLPSMTVLSLNEVPGTISIASCGMVQINRQRVN
jgi:flagellar biosynthesis protein FlhA